MKTKIWDLIAFGYHKVPRKDKIFPIKKPTYPQVQGHYDSDTILGIK